MDDEINLTLASTSRIRRGLAGHTKEGIQKDLETNVLRQLGIRDMVDRGEAFHILVSSLAAIVKTTKSSSLEVAISESNFSPLASLWNLRSRDFGRLETLVQRELEEEIIENLRELQVHVQRLLKPSTRKKLAAYYTKTLGLKLMAKSAKEYALLNRKPLLLADPFLGSGMTLCDTIDLIKTDNVSKVWGVEPHPLSATVAYAALLQATGGASEKIEVVVGDAFKRMHERLSSSDSPDETSDTLARANVIVTNPPFTRWEILDKPYRKFLTELVKLSRYSPYVQRRQLNLQLISLFLMDFILEPNGLLASVLPAATFYTIYGKAAKKLLREKYMVYAIAEYKGETSFSVDSGFKEVIVIAEKKTEIHETAFVGLTKEDDSELGKIARILSGNRYEDINTNWMGISQIPSLWENNWLTLFEQNPLRELLSEIFQKAMENETLETWLTVYGDENILRGLEMYGPEFFLIPNKSWNITKEGRRSITISRDGQQLEISRSNLVRALRKPELYTDKIVPQVGHYFLTVPTEHKDGLSKDLVEYIEWGQKSQIAKPAIEVFGKRWYSHIYRQIQTKNPFGHVFLPDKVDPSFRNRGVFACYTEEPLTASKNFYIATFGDPAKDKAMAAWFNSTLFIALFVLASRRIGERWTRFLEEDYLRMPVLNVERLSKDDVGKLVKVIDAIKNDKLNPISLQLGKEYRTSLDRAVFETLGLEPPRPLLEQLHYLLSRHMIP